MAELKKSSHVKNRYFSQQSRKPKGQHLEAGLQGFLCTCNSQEKSCIREAYNLLNEYADKLYGSAKSKRDADSGDDDEEADISDQLGKQIAEIKADRRLVNRFQSIPTSVPNCVFIRCDVGEPVELAHGIMQDIYETKVPRTRFLLRMVPIQVTCPIKLDAIVAQADKLFDKYFTGEPTTFSIVFHKRYSTSSKDAIIKALAELVVSKNPEHKVDLVNAKTCVIVELLKAICLMSVVPDYFKLKKYNMVEMCAQKNAEGQPEPAPDGAPDQEQ